MDVAYDHIQEEVLTPEDAAKRQGEASSSKPANLNTEFQEAYKSFSASPWGAKLGGFFSDVKKQSTTFYDEARSEAGVVGGEAVRGLTGLRQSLVSRARSMSVGQTSSAAAEGAEKGEESKERSQSEALRESEGMISRFRSEAAKRLKDLEKAEVAADAAIFRFGANIGNFLKDAVTVAPPTDEKNKDGSSKILFESKDQDGKRVIHGTRFEAQLHAIHTSLDKFTKDPESEEYASWKEDFDIDKKTESIRQDLEKYEELRKTMEKLVPEKVDYKNFWYRYYFLRMIIEADEQRRKEFLKGKFPLSYNKTLPILSPPEKCATQSPEDHISWDTDSNSEPDDNEGNEDDDGDKKRSNPQQHGTPKVSKQTGSPASLTTINAPDLTQAKIATSSSSSKSTSSSSNLKPAEESRNSQDEKSQPDSDASYDLVSGATSRAPGSPKEGRKVGGGNEDGEEEEGEEEEEEDWE